eukprot:TRINITY_DN27453_c0_g1_i1.p1 TRINITY_DN27453_c0_g1~~TRINITY_DN27453_c0_g1_i1.p1  ORF type:complete len:1728 (+),score=506.01 TRINITY_DN27453_c0_g1_i1:96-5279(+)
MAEVRVADATLLWLRVGEARRVGRALEEEEKEGARLGMYEALRMAEERLAVASKALRSTPHELRRKWSAATEVAAADVRRCAEALTLGASPDDATSRVDTMTSKVQLHLARFAAEARELQSTRAMRELAAYCAHPTAGGVATATAAAPTFSALSSGAAGAGRPPVHRPAPPRRVRAGDASHGLHFVMHGLAVLAGGLQGPAALGKLKHNSEVATESRLETALIRALNTPQDAVELLTILKAVDLLLVHHGGGDASAAFPSALEADLAAAAVDLLAVAAQFLDAFFALVCAKRARGLHRSSANPFAVDEDEFPAAEQQLARHLHRLASRPTVATGALASQGVLESVAHPGDAVRLLPQDIEGVVGPDGSFLNVGSSRLSPLTVEGRPRRRYFVGQGVYVRNVRGKVSISVVTEEYLKCTVYTVMGEGNVMANNLAPVEENINFATLYELTQRQAEWEVNKHKRRIKDLQNCYFEHADKLDMLRGRLTKATRVLRHHAADPPSLLSATKGAGAIGQGGAAPSPGSPERARASSPSYTSPPPVPSPMKHAPAASQWITVTDPRHPTAALLLPAVLPSESGGVRLLDAPASELTAYLQSPPAAAALAWLRAGVPADPAVPLRLGAGAPPGLAQVLRCGGATPGLGVLAEAAPLRTLLARPPRLPRAQLHPRAARVFLGCWGDAPPFLHSPDDAAVAVPDVVGDVRLAPPAAPYGAETPQEQLLAQVWEALSGGDEAAAGVALQGAIEAAAAAGEGGAFPAQTWLATLPLRPDPDVLDAWYDPLVHRAVRSGWADGVLQVVAAAPDTWAGEARNGRHCTALHAAAAATPRVRGVLPDALAPGEWVVRMTTIVEALCASGVRSVDLPDAAGRTPLHVAVGAGHTGVAQVLLDAGASCHHVLLHLGGCVPDTDGFAERMLHRIFRRVLTASGNATASPEELIASLLKPTENGGAHDIAVYSSAGLSRPLSPSSSCRDSLLGSVGGGAAAAQEAGEDDGARAWALLDEERQREWVEAFATIAEVLPDGAALVPMLQTADRVVDEVLVLLAKGKLRTASECLARAKGDAAAAEVLARALHTAAASTVSELLTFPSIRRWLARCGSRYTPSQVSDRPARPAAPLHGGVEWLCARLRPATPPWWRHPAPAALGGDGAPADVARVVANLDVLFASDAVPSGVVATDGLRLRDGADLHGHPILGTSAFGVAVYGGCVAVARHAARGRDQVGMANQVCLLALAQGVAGGGVVTYSPLAAAVALGDAAMVSFLLESGAEPGRAQRGLYLPLNRWTTPYAVYAPFRMPSSCAGGGAALHVGSTPVMHEDLWCVVGLYLPIRDLLHLRRAGKALQLALSDAACWQTRWVRMAVRAAKEAEQPPHPTQPPPPPAHAAPPLHPPPPGDAPPALRAPLLSDAGDAAEVLVDTAGYYATARRLGAAVAAHARPPSAARAGSSGGRRMWSGGSNRTATPPGRPGSRGAGGYVNYMELTVDLLRGAGKVYRKQHDAGARGTPPLSTAAQWDEPGWVDRLIDLRGGAALPRLVDFAAFDGRAAPAPQSRATWADDAPNRTPRLHPHGSEAVVLETDADVGADDFDCGPCQDVTPWSALPTSGVAAPAAAPVGYSYYPLGMCDYRAVFSGPGAGRARLRGERVAACVRLLPPSSLLSISAAAGAALDHPLLWALRRGDVALAAHTVPSPQVGPPTWGSVLHGVPGTAAAEDVALAADRVAAALAGADGGQGL